MKRVKPANVFFLMSALLLPLSATADDRVFVQVPATIAREAWIPNAVRSQCAVDTLVGNYALSAVGKRFPSAQPATAPDQAGGATFVQLTVFSVIGFGGGSWSGAKSMGIRVEILKGGTVVRSTSFTRSSNGGVFGGFKGTCSILDRVAGALGKDVAAWMARGPGAQRVKPDEGTSDAEREAPAEAGK